MASPRWKVYDPQGTYQASCKDVEATAVLMGFYGDGSTIRDGHTKIIWTQGENGDGDATESYDIVAMKAYM